MLADVLARLGAPSGGEMRGNALLLAVVAQARDGAMLTDGDGRFRLAVAGDTRGARSVLQVVSLRLAELP